MGPGDAELLTLKAMRVLRAAPVVAYPAPLKGSGLARQIVESVLSDGLYRIEIAMRMRFNLDRTSAQTAYDRGAAAIATHLAAGRDVAVLCEGDPLFFGSFAYILARLGDRFPVEIVPGVNSIAACSAVLQQPFALLNDRVVIIPASRPAAEIEDALVKAESTAILKVGRHWDKVVRVLDRLDLRRQAWHIERASQTGQQVRSLATVEATVERSSTYFSMILVYRRGERWLR
ncbi:Cobalt-precorrin-2 C20-methyltransferase [invertebrate metagenome]|uniref:Cobalt-precorrin-2 C20-methyltransferase n=1 Tax=invertebrate metagenome TaxID=1711999 RepID=A0A484H6N6_9ZZZZ